MSNLQDASPLVIVIDDDPLVRRALDSLFRSIGMATALYESASQFLDQPPPEGVSCIVTDVRMPGVSGLDFQKELATRGVQTPFVIITGHGDVPMSVKAMKAGAVDFLMKPFRDQDLIDAVNEALDRDRRRRTKAEGVAELESRYAALTPREKQVMALVVSGLMNKQAAAELGLSEITVKLHRSSLMRKMQAHTVAELVRMSQAVAPVAEA